MSGKRGLSPGYHDGLTDEDIFLTVYRRDDGSVVVHVETPTIDENGQGPLLTIYLNDDLDDPLWDNREPDRDTDEWICPGCQARVEPSLVRRHRDNCTAAL